MKSFGTRAETKDFMPEEVEEPEAQEETGPLHMVDLRISLKDLQATTRKDKLN